MERSVGWIGLVVICRSWRAVLASKRRMCTSQVSLLMPIARRALAVWRSPLLRAA